MCWCEKIEQIIDHLTTIIFNTPPRGNEGPVNEANEESKISNNIFIHLFMYGNIDKTFLFNSC